MSPAHLLLKLMPLTQSSSGEVLVGTTCPPGHMQKLKTPRLPPLPGCGCHDSPPRQSRPLSPAAASPCPWPLLLLLPLPSSAAGPRAPAGCGR
jgi:hypothetical protein